MFAKLHHQGTQPRTAAPPAGPRLRRIAAVLAAVTTGVLVSAATIPAAFARDVPNGHYGPAPVPATTVHAATTGGTAGWQMALIALIALIAFSAAVAVLRPRGRAAAHRAVPSAAPGGPSARLQA